MRKNYYLSILLSIFTAVLFAQNGEISGKIVDENGEAIPFANIALVEGGVPTGVGATTDFDGFYSIKPLNPGNYDVKFSYIGYTSVIKTGVVVKNDKSTYLDQKLSPSEMKIEEVVVVRYKIPLIDAGQTSSQQTMVAEDIENLATRDITNIASTTAGVQKDSDGQVSIRGSRGDGVVYYVDGIRVNGQVNLPVTAVEQIDVIVAGVPAKYGEATGGVINVSTKGGARKLMGGVEVLESLDRWRFDLVNVNLAGPIVKNKENKTVVGFAVNAEYNHQKDPSPSAVKMYKVKDEKLTELQESPLFLQEDVILEKAEQLTFDDLEENRINPNVRAHTGRLNLRLDFRLNDDMKISVGGNGNYDRRHRRIDRYSLLNSENNPLYTTWNYRGFVRFTHNIKKKASEDGEEQAKGLFQNGFYSVQAGYEKYSRRYEDDSHGDNSFAYGYIGQFKTERTPVYSTADGYYNLVSFNESNLLYKPGESNTFGSTYTSQYYELSGAELNEDGFYETQDGAISSINDLNGSIALINGKRAEVPYDLWFNTGRQYNGHGIDNNNDQFSAKIDAGFDILKSGAESRNKHSISLGFAFEQRISREYTVSPLGLWDIARRNVNSHLQLNENEAYLIENGDTTLVQPNDPASGTGGFFLADTIFRFYENDPSANQSMFDKNLREKIGAGEFEFIDMDNLPLETFSVDMFSADELLDAGNNLVTYRGYDVHGNLTNDRTSFADFWNKVDEEGNKTRPIAPFRPIYMAGYIEDKFQLKDLTFRIGLRVDRYDANQSVLRDPYSIVGSRTVGEARELVTGEIPTNIKDDFVIYVDGQENPSVLGFRDGDTWYNVEGQPVANVAAIQGTPVPLLPEDQTTSTTDQGFKPELAFEDYKAQYTVMPRLQFSFNISDNALFFAHYDVLAQSPQSRIRDGFFTNRSIGNPLDYYFFNEVGAVPISNPNLKAETTIDFQLGFKQKLNKSSALTFSAYFKEFKNQIQVRRYDGVFPNPGEYYSYDNVDFGTTKGFEFGYEMRRTNNLKLNFNYTLQFADGTGSDDRTQLQVVQNSQENFRNVAALDFDSRHSINLIVDYRFGSGDDYNGPTTKKGGQILSNFGINLLTQVRSGTPYTQQVRASDERSRNPGRINAEGTINGSRIGWNFNMDLKINKSFDVAIKSKKEDKEDTNLNFDIYLRVDNLLGLANVRNVYRFTGSPSDDGWLGSPQGQVLANNADNPQSYRDLYQAGMNDQANYSLPRRVFIGASIFF